LKTPITRLVWFFCIPKEPKALQHQKLLLIRRKNSAWEKRCQGKAGFFAHGVNIIIIFLCEGRLELLK